MAKFANRFVQMMFLVSVFMIVKQVWFGDSWLRDLTMVCCGASVGIQVFLVLSYLDHN